ncbi:MAG: hypothetical protein JNM78_20020 [Cyclobacteriaceae bacterium]|nr:hypothetical protein [Cyclobacteriaceae bacterium]
MDSFASSIICLTIMLIANVFHGGRIYLAFNAILLLFISQTTWAQKRDSTLYFKSALSVTQNGFSFIPSFSLGKPAAILDLAIGNKRLSFEPQFRYALEGKPWSFIFIYRYKVIDRSKFQLLVGGHIPAIVFATRTATINGVTRDVSVSQRFLAAELAPTYLLSKNLSTGFYLLRGHGFQQDGVQDSYFIGYRVNFNNVKLTDLFFMRFNPQLYYLKTDDLDGYYVTYTLTLAMKDFPLSISHIANKTIKSDIPAKDFDWNVSLIYSFDKNYIRK